MSVRLYGRAFGEGSHVQVTRGIRGALGARVVGFVALDDQSGNEDEAQPPGATAPAAVFTGRLDNTGVMLRNARHEQRYAVVAPNSNRLPERLLAAMCSTCTVLLAPSEWARGVIESELTRVLAHAPSGTQRPRTLTCAHGVDAAFQRIPSRRDRAVREFGDGRFRVLHLSTSDRQRKSTQQLVEAWIALTDKKGLPRGASLTLVLDPEALTRFRAWLIDDEISLPPSVIPAGRVGADPKRMAEGFSEYHLICQPSRGEAFGLTPPEARACGVPVLMTACTGHSAHAPPAPSNLRPGAAYISRGCVVVAHGADAQIDDLPDALAPAVTAESIADGLLASVENWEALNEEAGIYAADVRDEWSWDRQTQPLLTELDK